MPSRPSLFLWDTHLSLPTGNHLILCPLPRTSSNTSSSLPFTFSWWLPHTSVKISSDRRRPTAHSPPAPTPAHIFSFFLRHTESPNFPSNSLYLHFGSIRFLRDVGSSGCRFSVAGPHFPSIARLRPSQEQTQLFSSSGLLPRRPTRGLDALRAALRAALLMVSLLFLMS